MKASAVIHNLTRLIEKHGDQECYVGVLACDPASEPAEQHRYCITKCEFTSKPKMVFPTCNKGRAFEILIHQNESLRSWDDAAK